MSHLTILRTLRGLLGGLVFLVVASCGQGVDSNEVVTPRSSVGDGGSPSEKQMLALARAHSQQKRSQLVWDARLGSVARQRAADMGTRCYFNHIDPDGLGPNWHVTQSGYRLPVKWTAFKNANQIESISAGSATAEETFYRWMNSKKHVSHLLALNPFYQDQTRIGIGHAHVPGSPHRDYWVFLSAPPEN